MIRYGVINEQYKTVGADVDKIIRVDQLHSLLDIIDSENYKIIVPTIKVLGDSLNMITNALNIIHDKEVSFKALEEHIDSENVQDYEMFLVNANMLNDIVLEKADDSKIKQRIGGAKRGRRVEFTFPSDFEDKYQEVKMGNITKTSLAEHYGITRQTIYDWFDRYDRENKLGKYRQK